MIFDVSVALTWILFLALLPMAFIWLRRANRILRQKNYAEVALKHGVPPAEPKKWAPFVALINLIAGGITINSRSRDCVTPVPGPSPLPSSA